MNYYAARQRKETGFWDWTCMRDNMVWPTGACSKECQHKTKAEAEEHEAERIRTKIRGAEKKDIDTKFGHACDAPGCKEKSFKYVSLGVEMYQMCDAHFEDLSWFSMTDVQITSSY